MCSGSWLKFSPSRNLTAVASTFRATIYFELSFVYGMDQDSFFPHI